MKNLHENSRLFCESFINTFLCKGLNNFEKEIVATNTRSDIFFIWNLWASHNYRHYLLTETINEKALKPARHKQHRTDSIAAYLWFWKNVSGSRESPEKLNNEWLQSVTYRMSVSTSLRIRRTSRTWIMTSLMELLNCLNIFLQGLNRNIRKSHPNEIPTPTRKQFWLIQNQCP